jgi:hypothetical protein
MFLASLKAVRSDYRHRLEQVETGTLDLPDSDFDTGKPTRAGEYSLADRTYANLLAQLRKEHYRDVTPELRANILVFYDHFDATRTPRHCKVCRNIPQELEEIKAAPAHATNVAVAR